MMDPKDIARLITEDPNLTIPPEHQAAFDKALAWRPKLKGWRYSRGKAAQAVLSGKKPMITGYREDILQELADEYGLEIFDDLAFLPENRDIAEMIKWAEENLDKESNHYILGIALGYPIEDVNNWVEGWKAAKPPNLGKE